MIAEDGSIEVVEVLAETSTALSEGEVLQLTTSNDVHTSEEDYLKVIDAKTAALFAAACRVGGIVAECDKSEKDEAGSSKGDKAKGKKKKQKSETSTDDEE